MQAIKRSNLSMVHSRQLLGWELSNSLPLITLQDVLCVPNLSCNMLSISKFTYDNQCRSNFYSSYCDFQNLTTGRMIGSAKEKDGLNYFDDETDLSRQFQSTNVNSVFVSKENDISI